MPPLYRIGVDVGGTNTDAAILDITAAATPTRGVLASHKAATTPDITSGIESAIRAVLSASAVDHARVLSVTVGTTHFINALVEADVRRLARVAVVRLCGPFTRQIPPFADFPAGLRRVLDGGVYYLDGGLEIDGREIKPLDRGQIEDAARRIVGSGVRAVALVGVFSPLDHEGLHENECRKIMLEVAPGLDVVCSKDIGPPGLLERENATILNAAILNTAKKVTRGFKSAMARLGLTCPLYLSQNDGTLIDVDVAAVFPIKTFASGPTNSMTGAAFLAGLDREKVHKDVVGGAAETSSSSSGPQEPQILVIDIGGTTTDVCALLPSGFPRQAPGFVELGGVRTAFSMPEVLSIGLGGGSKVVVSDADEEDVTVGPVSVGHLLTEQAWAFGGSELTATDIVIAADKVDLGDKTLVQGLSRRTVEAARKRIKTMLEGLVEHMRVSAAPVHVLLCGGGAILVTEDLKGVEKCIVPIHQGAANAVGAAIGKISGEVDVVEIPEGREEKDIVAGICRRAIDLAVSKGAAPDDVMVVEINKIPLQYVTNNAMRVQVRAVGRLAVPDSTGSLPRVVYTQEADEEEERGTKTSIPDALESTIKPSIKVDLKTYRPDVREGVWYLSEVDLELISTGCGVLGTGGGGPTHHEFLKGLHTLRTHGPGKLRVVSAASLSDDALLGFGCWYGSPHVINERIAGGGEIAAGLDALRRVSGKKKLEGIMTMEIGGGNGLSAFPTGAMLDVPVIDGDCMGRAYPTIYHTTLSVYGYPVTPCSLSDSQGNVNIVMSVDTPVRLERLLRTAAIEMGLGCAVCANPVPASALKSHGILNTISQAWYLGRAVHRAKREKTSYVDAIFSECAGRLLYTGKIVNVNRFLGGGYTMGSVLIAPLDKDDADHSTAPRSFHPVSTTRHMSIPFQNEYLYAALTDADGSEAAQEVVCTVPDLISILGQDGEAIGSQDLRYGLRVSVIGLPANPLWKTERGMPVGGPVSFGLKMSFVGVGEYTEPRSVIDEFAV